jgi:hypothetical protein
MLPVTASDCRESKFVVYGFHIIFPGSLMAAERCNITPLTHLAPVWKCYDFYMFHSPPTVNSPLCTVQTLNILPSYFPDWHDIHIASKYSSAQSYRGDVKLGGGGGGNKGRGNGLHRYSTHPHQYSEVDTVWGAAVLAS